MSTLVYKYVGKIVVFSQDSGDLTLSRILFIFRSISIRSFPLPVTRETFQIQRPKSQFTFHSSFFSISANFYQRYSIFLSTFLASNFLFSFTVAACFALPWTLCAVCFGLYYVPARYSCASDDHIETHVQVSASVIFRIFILIKVCYIQIYKSQEMGALPVQFVGIVDSENYIGSRLSVSRVSASCQRL